jgi:hypothetical protein
LPAGSHSSMASDSAHATAGAAAGLSGLHLTEAHAGGSSRGPLAAQCVAATTGNVGAVPKGGGFGGQQVRQHL